MTLKTKNKPVQPTAPGHHGFFGVPYFKTHLMMDKRWEPNNLTNQYKCMADVLEKHYQYKKHENDAVKKRYLRENRSLRQQCRDGRVKLQMALHTTNSKKIRNYLMNYKDMQRLYHSMPIHMVEDNINQKTFVLRKERDRLKNRLNQLVVGYEEKLVEKANLENRIKYQNEFVLDEEIQSKQIRNKIECSNVRLNAIKTLNDAYKRTIKLLITDEIYYEPILRSLQKDIDNQAQFTNYIIELGLPAITKLQEITEQHRKLEDKARRNISSKLQWVQNYKKRAQQRQADLRKLQAKGEGTINYFKRYVRETPSMMELKWELESIETTIKRVKFATLCSKATEVYPRIKKQIEDNQRLHKVLDGDMVVHQSTEKKLERADVMRGILEHNLTKEELARIDKIKYLKDQIKQEKIIEEEAIAYLKERGQIFLLIRYVLWNYNEILRNVLRSHKTLKIQFPTIDLKLPLLKFENRTMEAYPPDGYEEKIDSLLQNFKKRVIAIMAVYKEQISKEVGLGLEKEYHELFLNSLDVEDDWSEKDLDDPDVDETQERKLSQNVPTRKQLKQISAKMVEELSKKDD
ncbi:uncharacterized protein LOC129915587 [Episyrphus balteatus]|uniref:uncharacterized protein LOC129915587 n=1 Tax=Episyrphus balteatus TaxID=286459 RepID=UPI0024862392|nr:uncharacterized protein LOC129915587 [Episyrphus balteatus]